MMLALRADHAQGANAAERAFAALTRWRLASQWCHGGIVIGERLYHANARCGLHESDYTPERWTLIDLGPGLDAWALQLFSEMQGARYDFAGVLGFGLPCVQGSDDRLYCFEWCALAMGVPAARWMTPERLLAHLLRRHLIV